MIPPKRFDIFSPDWGMLRRPRRVQIFLQTTIFSEKRNFFVEGGNRTLLTPLLGFQGSRGSRKIKKRSTINCSLFLLYTLISKDEKINFFVEGGNRTTVNAMIRVSI